MRSIVAGKVIIYLLGYVVAKINQDVSVQRSMVWQLTSVVSFFDLDGTLHQQDMFGSFLRYLLRRQPLNALLVLPLLPIIAIALLIKGRAARWPMSSASVGVHFGHSERTFTDVAGHFVRWFRDNVTAFPLVQERLTTYLLSSDADIWLNLPALRSRWLKRFISIRPGCRGLILSPAKFSVAMVVGY